MHKHAGKTVREILKGKKGSIKEPSLDEGSPSWAELLDVTWEDIEEGAKQGRPGYKTIKKLLGGKEYDKK
jgi:hypothetical protein